MPVLTRPWGAMHYAVDGPEGGPLVVFANSLGTDLRLWDGLLPLLPQGLRIARFDKRGHGLSDTSADVSIAGFAEDAAALIESLGAGKALFIGLSIGGLTGQALAAARPELLSGLVLSNTAAKIGTAESWRARIEATQAEGIESFAESVLERWFSPAFRATPELALWRNMLVRTPAKGYAAACAAIAAADYRESTARLSLPVLGIGGELDGSTPPDLVEETVRSVAGAQFHVLAGTGHLPHVEAPHAYARLISRFVRETGHMQSE